MRTIHLDCFSRPAIIICKTQESPALSYQDGAFQKSCARQVCKTASTGFQGEGKRKPRQGEPAGV